MNAYLTSCGDATTMGTVAGGTRRVVRCVTSARGRRVCYLLLAVWILNVFDLSLTVRAQADGMLYEGNPLARAVLSRGAAAIYVFKLGLVAGASYLLFNLRKYRCAEVASTLVLLAYLGVAWQWRQCYVMYELAHTGFSYADEVSWNDAFVTNEPFF